MIFTTEMYIFLVVGIIAFSAIIILEIFSKKYSKKIPNKKTKKTLPIQDKLARLRIATITETERLHKLDQIAKQYLAVIYSCDEKTTYENYVVLARKLRDKDLELFSQHMLYTLYATLERTKKQVVSLINEFSIFVQAHQPEPAKEEGLSRSVAHILENATQQVTPSLPPLPRIEKPTAVQPQTPTSQTSSLDSESIHIIDDKERIKERINSRLLEKNALRKIQNEDS